jgi:hypothetical protein
LDEEKGLLEVEEGVKTEALDKNIELRGWISKEE